MTNKFSPEFEKRLSWDKESLEQLVMLDPETLEPVAMWRTLLEREAEKMSEAIREVAAEDDARRAGNS